MTATAGGVGGVVMTPAELAALGRWRAAMGLPLHVTDPATSRDVAALMLGRSPTRNTRQRASTDNLCESYPQYGSPQLKSQEPPRTLADD